MYSPKEVYLNFSLKIINIYITAAYIFIILIWLKFFNNQASKKKNLSINAI